MGGSGEGGRELLLKCEWCGGSHMLNLAGVAATTGCAVGFTSTAG